MNVWDMVTSEADRKGHVTVSRHVLREMFDSAPASVQASIDRDRAGALESMLDAALRRIQELEAQVDRLHPTRPTD